jgi:hypothetical protein
MPRAKVPRIAIEYVELVDKRGVADLCRVFGCSRRAAEDLVLQARRAVAQGRRYEVLEPPTGAAAVANYRRPPMPGRAISDAEVRELAAGIDPPEVKHLTADERYALQRERQDQERRERNAAKGYPEVDPQWQQHWNSLTPEERERLRRAPA